MSWDTFRCHRPAPSCCSRSSASATSAARLSSPATCPSTSGPACSPPNASPARCSIVSPTTFTSSSSTATASGSSTANAGSRTINRRQNQDKTLRSLLNPSDVQCNGEGGDPPRAPPDRSQTTIPSNPQTDVFFLRPPMYFRSGLDTSAFRPNKQNNVSDIPDVK